MKFAESTDNQGLTIRAYEPGRIVVGNRAFRASLLLSPDGIIPDWPPVSASGIAEAHFEPILSMAPEVVILGTGSRQVFPPPAVYARLMALRIGLEIMGTGAACRTYNVLLSEGRRVVAALIVP